MPNGLVPNIGQAVVGGLQTAGAIQQFQQRGQLQEQQQQQQALLGQLFGGQATPEQQQLTINQLGQINPQLAGQAQTVLQQRQQQQQLGQLQETILRPQERLGPTEAGPPLPTDIRQQRLQEAAFAQRQIEQEFPERAEATQKARKARFEALGLREQARIDSVVKGAQDVVNLPAEQQLTTLQRRREELIGQGLPTGDTDEVISLLQTGDAQGAQQLLQNAVDTGISLDIIKPQVKAATEIRKEVRGAIRTDLRSISKETGTITSNFNKIQNLAGEIRKGNRLAVAQGLVSLVKLGDPTSVVSATEMATSLNAQNPISAVSDLLTGKGVSSNIVNSIVTKIDPLNPSNINVDDLLDTARVSVNAFVPQIQRRFEGAQESARGNLTEEGIRSLFTQSLTNTITGLSELTGETPSPPPTTTPAGELSDAELAQQLGL